MNKRNRGDLIFKDLIRYVFMIICIFRSIYAPSPDLDPIIERMSKSRDGER